ncbi:MAG: FecR domain-containing protein [Rhodospirillales bacterium]|nr:FecR domain-containing protein [Rhodospirillales bacterium]
MVKSGESKQAILNGQGQPYAHKAEGAFVSRQAPASEPNHQAIIQAQPNQDILLQNGQALSVSDYIRQGPDLLLVGPDGNTILIRDYFTLEDAPDILSADGAYLPGDLVVKLAGPLTPGMFAQAGAATGQQAIGRADTTSGDVTVVHADGSKGILHKGDPIYQGDVLQTIKGATVGLVFMDGTTLALGSNGRLVLDQMVYDPGTQTGKSAFSLVQGSFSFVSGQIAKSAPDASTIRTPVATIGIRGTMVAGSFTHAADHHGGIGEGRQQQLKRSRGAAEGGRSSWHNQPARS